MAKEIAKIIKIQIPAGEATAAPPVGTLLGPAGINLGEFCQRFNDASKDRKGDIIPVELTLYEDRTYDFILKTPPAAFLIKRYANIAKGSAKGANEIVATITRDDIKKIAEIKMPDLNANSLEAAMEIIIGTARNMGVAVKGINDSEMSAQAEEAAEKEVEQAKRAEELERLEEEAKEMAEAAETGEVETEVSEQKEKNEQETVKE